MDYVGAICPLLPHIVEFVDLDRDTHARWSGVGIEEDFDCTPAVDHLAK